MSRFTRNMCRLALALALTGWMGTALLADEPAPDQDDNQTDVQNQTDSPPTTQPTVGGAGGGGGGGEALPMLGGYVGGSAGGGGGGSTDPEALNAAGGGGLGGGSGGGGGGSSGDQYVPLAATSNAPLPAAIWMGLAAASGIGVWVKSRRKA